MEDKLGIGGESFKLKEDYSDLTLEKIENTIVKFLHSKIEDNEEEISKVRLPSIKHYEWEENGKKYSSWKIDTGTNIINTGDGGMKLIEEAFKKRMNEI